MFVVVMCDACCLLVVVSCSMMDACWLYLLLYIFCSLIFVGVGLCSSFGDAFLVSWFVVWLLFDVCALSSFVVRC